MNLGKGYMGIFALFLKCFYYSELFQNLKLRETKRRDELKTRPSDMETQGSNTGLFPLLWAVVMNWISMDGGQLCRSGF